MQLLVTAPPVGLLPPEERWSTTGQVLPKGQPLHYWTGTRWWSPPGRKHFGFTQIIRPHVYPTAAKLTIKSLIMSIEFILIATVWVSYQNEAILNNRQRSVTLVAAAAMLLQRLAWQIVGAPVLMCFRSAHVLPPPWQFTQHSYT